MMLASKLIPRPHGERIKFADAGSALAVARELSCLIFRCEHQFGTSR